VWRQPTNAAWIQPALCVLIEMMWQAAPRQFALNANHVKGLLTEAVEELPPVPPAAAPAGEPTMVVPPPPVVPPEVCWPVVCLESWMKLMGAVHTKRTQGATLNRKAAAKKLGRALA